MSGINGDKSRFHRERKIAYSGASATVGERSVFEQSASGRDYLLELLGARLRGSHCQRTRVRKRASMSFEKAVCIAKKLLPGSSGFIVVSGLFFADSFAGTLACQRLFHARLLARLQVIGVTLHFPNNVFLLDLAFEPTQRSPALRCSNCVVSNVCLNCASGEESSCPMIRFASTYAIPWVRVL